jgi:hypothetical protein
MTPKQKAKELVNKFHIKVLDREGTSAMNEFESKQCALIAVDEIIEVLSNDINPLVNYWQEVKQEIEKLWHNKQQ